MAKITNYAAGPRGITLKDGSTVWLNPGESEEIRKDDIAGELPDLGQPRAVSVDADDDLKARVADLQGQVEALTKERDDLKARVAKFDADGDGKPGGSKPAPK